MTMQRCPSCGHRFAVLDDEQGQHECPRCGFGPGDIVERDSDTRAEDDDASE